MIFTNSDQERPAPLFLYTSKTSKAPTLNAKPMSRSNPSDAAALASRTRTIQVATHVCTLLVLGAALAADPVLVLGEVDEGEDGVG